MANIKDAIEYAKKDPNGAYAVELRKRIESGSFNKELQDAGLTEFITDTTEQVKETKTTGEKVLGVVAPSTQKFGKTIATVLTADKNIQDFNEASKSNSDIALNLTKAINENKKLGKDTSRLEQALTLLQENKPEMSQFTGVENITPKQVVGQAVGTGLEALSGGALSRFTGVENITPKQVVGQAVGTGLEALSGGALSSGVNNLTRSASLLEKIKQGATIGGTYGAVSGLSSGLEQDKSLGGIVGDVATSATTGAVIGGAIPTVVPVVKGITSKIPKTVTNTTPDVISKGKDFITKTITDITENVNATQSTKTSLNPFKTDNDTIVSVPLKNNKFVLKPANKLNEAEKKVIQAKTNKTYEEALAQSKKYVTSRTNENPLDEIVAKRTDTAMKQADKIRRENGAIMGEVESSYKDVPVDMSGSKINTFIDEFFKGGKKFGRKTKDMEFQNDFVDQYDELVKNPTVENTLDFTRQWQKELDDLKDGFGSFKQNKRTYTVLEGAINDLKNNTRNVIAKESPQYRDALAKYRITSELRDEGNRLLGQEGLLGQRIKGSATAKRAVQSNSDGGSRQFYKQLKNLTGYDGIKDAEIVIQAMEDVGDTQGLSLLGVVADTNKSILSKGLSKVPFGDVLVDVTEKGVNKILPAEKRTRNLINKSK